MGLDFILIHYIFNHVHQSLIVHEPNLCDTKSRISYSVQKTLVAKSVYKIIVSNVGCTSHFLTKGSGTELSKSRELSDITLSKYCFAYPDCQGEKCKIRAKLACLYLAVIFNMSEILLKCLNFTFTIS